MKRAAGQFTAFHCVLAGVLCAPIVAGCRREAKPEETAKPEPAAVESAESGDVTLHVRSNRSKVRIAEPVALTIEAQAPADVELQWPEAETLFEGYHVRRSGTVETESIDNDRVTWRQTVELESFTSGRRELPGVTIGFAGGEVATEPIPIEVLSAVEGDVDPQKFDDIAGPVTLNRPPDRRWIYWTAGGAAAALLAGLLLWWFIRNRRRRLATPAPAPPPHVWAMQSIDRLLAERLIEAGKVQEFYYRLSNIVRTYIELRFGLHAAEQTTPEFLNDLRRGSELSFGHKDLLGDFLTACDMVKYALHQPAGTNIDASIDTARTFIRETARAEQSVEVGGPA